MTPRIFEEQMRVTTKMGIPTQIAAKVAPTWFKGAMDALRSSKALGEMGMDPRFASVFDPKADPSLRKAQVDQFLDAYFYDKRREMTGPHKMPSGQIRPGGQPTFRLQDLISNFNDEKLVRAAQHTEGFNIQKLIDNLGPNGTQYLDDAGVLGPRVWRIAKAGAGRLRSTKL